MHPRILDLIRGTRYSLVGRGEHYDIVDMHNGNDIIMSVTNKPANNNIISILNLLEKDDMTYLIEVCDYCSYAFSGGDLTTLYSHGILGHCKRSKHLYNMLKERGMPVLV